MSPDSDRAREIEIVRFMCNHLVVLSAQYREMVNGQPQGPTLYTFLSGFILEFGQGWWFTTAGHILDDEHELGDSIRTNRIRASNWALVDFLGSSPVVCEPMPYHFDVDRVLYFQLREGALDFALHPLSILSQPSLKANRIVPISRENWTGTDQMEFEGYAMLGVPRPPMGSREIIPTLVSVRRLTDIPGGL